MLFENHNLSFRRLTIYVKIKENKIKKSWFSFKYQKFDLVYFFIIGKDLANYKLMFYSQHCS